MDVVTSWVSEAFGHLSYMATVLIGSLLVFVSVSVVARLALRYMRYLAWKDAGK